MIADMVNVMKRISELQKRFGLMRHNTINQQTVPKKIVKTFDENLKNKIENKQLNKLNSLNRNSLNPNYSIKPNLYDKKYINSIIDKYSEIYKIPSGLVKSVVQNESSYNHRAVSKKGALGLMQLMPSVIKERGVKNPFNPEENINAGTSLLKDLLKKYNGDYKLALAAYNSGVGNVQKHKGVPNFPETKQYINNVIESYKKNQ